MMEQDLVDEIVSLGKLIGKMSETDELSRNVIRYYDMFYKCQEPGSFILLESAFIEWKLLHMPEVQS